MAVDRSPYAIGPAGGRPAVLLHGLTGSPWDLRPLAEALAAAGYRVSAPRLHGHEHVDALAASRWSDWLGSAATALAEAHASGRRTLLLGFSMGALLALKLAAERPRELAGLIAMGVPIEQPCWQIVGARAVLALRIHAPRIGAKIGHYPKARSDVRVRAVADRRAALPELPYAAILEIGRLQAEVRASLWRVKTPTLLVHGAYDHVAPVDGSARVSQLLAADVVRRVIAPRSYHHVARDLDRRLVCAEVVNFAQRVVPA